MKEPLERLRHIFTLGPLLKRLIKDAGYNSVTYAETIGMAPPELKRILEGGDPLWSEINRIIKPLGHHLVIQKVHGWEKRKPKIIIKEVKFNGKPPETE